MKKLLYIILFSPLALFGQDNYSLSFDGVDDYVNLGQFEDYPKFNSSISFWFKSDTLTSEVPGHEYVAVFSKDCYSYCQKFLIGSNSVNDIGYYSMFSNTNSDNLIQNEWYFVVGTRNSSTGISKLYLNGELIDNQYINGVLQDTLVSEVGEFTCSSELFLGIQAISNPTHFYGLLDDVVIWNKELTQEEIQTYMFCPPTGNEEGLVGYWNFNEGQGNTLNDISGNENHGLINGGATYSEDVPEQNCEVSQSDGLVLAEALTEGLIAYYPFNGNANDEGSNGNHGEVINATLIDDRFGAPNNAYEFDADYQFTNGGSESYIQLPEISTNIGAPNSSFSISMWFRCYDPSTPGNIILNSGGDGISTIVGRVGVSGNVIDIYHRNPSTNNEANGSINIDSNWNNVIVIVDGELGEYKLFVNGNIDNSMTFSFDANETYFNAERTWQIGGISYAGSNNHQFHGAIDDISFWGRTLTEDEIQFLSSNNILYGCTILGSLNYNPFANSDDNLCVTYQDLTNSIDSLQTELANLNEQVTISLSSLQQALDTWNTTIDLSAGWNMFGYGCPTSIGVAEGLSNHTDIIVITKDNNGNVYMPEFGFNGIGDFTPGFGYQIKVTEAIEGFSLCDWYVNDIPEDNIVSLQEEVENLQSELDSIYGCIDETACNYDEIAVLDDGSCYNNDLGCGCDTPGPIEGYDCDGNELQYQVGGYTEGGIVFYIDETGQHGLVAAMEDLEGLYQWGCQSESVNGAEGQAIGTGYQNTLDVVAENCQTNPQNQGVGITASQAALSYETEGYTDWYLPSKYELLEMYHTIGNGGSDGNIGGFIDNDYWSSSEYNNYYAWSVGFSSGSAADYNKVFTFRVRVIRAF